jgi:hypothetical protein
MKFRLRLKGALAPIASTVAISIALTGCASQSPTGGSAIDRANANFGQTVATGAVSGAAVGALGGALLSPGNRGAGAAYGALAGGAIGTGAGYLVAKRNSDQAQTETTLEGQISASQQRAQDADSAATEARQDAAQAQAQSRTLLAQYKAGQISAADYHRQLSASAQQAQSIQSLIGKVQEQENQINQQIATAGPNAGPLKQSLGQLQSSKVSLQLSLDQLTAATSAVPRS